MTRHALARPGARALLEGVRPPGRRHRLLRDSRQVEARDRARAGLPAGRATTRSCWRSARSSLDLMQVGASWPRPRTTADERHRRRTRTRAARARARRAPEPARGAQRAQRRDDGRPQQTRSHEAETDPEIRALVLTGTGDRAFCAGMDLRGFAERRAGSIDRRRDGRLLPVDRRARSRSRWWAPPTPRRVAGGFELLLGCDVIVASSEAKFGLPEVKRGSVRRRERDLHSPRGSRWRSRWR